jgi:hypothetical protein
MDIIIESVNKHGHVFRTRLPKQMTTIGVLRVRGILETRMHNNIRTMNEDGNTLAVAA